MSTVADSERGVVSTTDPYGRIPDFLDRSRYFFFQIALQLYSRGSVDQKSKFSFPGNFILDFQHRI
jgi:hypothetical protein